MAEQSVHEAAICVVLELIEGDELAERRWLYDAEWHALAYRGSYVVAALLALTGWRCRACHWVPAGTLKPQEDHRC